MAIPAPLRSLRKISHELRHLLRREPVRRNELMQALVSEARKHDVTEARTCRPEQELTSMAQAYACYLESCRVYQQYVDQNQTREKTVQESARIVGLDLPKSPSSS